MNIADRLMRYNYHVRALSARKGSFSMLLSEKERAVIEDLQTQEKSCMEKYRRYEQEAKDPVLKDLFHQLHLKEKQHVIGKNEYGTQRNSGIALLNVNERIKLHYGDEYGLQISSSRLVGTEVEFVLPVKSPVYK